MCCHIYIYTYIYTHIYTIIFMIPNACYKMSPFINSYLRESSGICHSYIYK